jgi:hypothetical protein
MNTTFNELRKLARDKRDAAIKAVRDEYQASLNEINRLQRQLIPPKPSLRGQPKPDVPLRAQIVEVAPKHSTFTVRDILTLLELPDEDFARVRTTFDRLIKRGEIKRIKRGRANIPAIFAVTSYGPPTNELNDLNQIQAAEIVLREIGRPVDLTLLCVEMMERGFEPVAGKAGFKKSLRSAMGRSDKFIENDRFWNSQ